MLCMCLQAFFEGRRPILVAAGMSGRGCTDAEGVTHVINFDLPCGDDIEGKSGAEAYLAR